jgi:hypothetical protein
MNAPAITAAARATEATAKHDAHVQAWIHLNCPYVRLAYRKQACYFCVALTLCYRQNQKDFTNY